jgi:predicted permease
MSRWLLDLLLGLFPARFRRRHGRDLRAVLAERLAAERDPRRRDRLLRRALLDALVTLPRAWRDALRGAARAGRSGPTNRAGLLRGGVRANPFAGIGQDVGFGLRYLGRRPLRAATLVGTLAFALGAATAIISVTHAILLRALPYAEPGRILAVEPTQAGFSDGGVRLNPDFAAFPELEASALYIPDGAAALSLDDGSPARRITVAQVSEGFFRTLGVPLDVRGGLEPAAGDLPDRIVLSHDLWRGAFGADQALVGRTVRINDRPLLVVGIAPPEVTFPGATDAWLPLPMWIELYGSAFGPDVIARLRDGVPTARLLERTTARVRAEWAETGASGSQPEVRLRPLREELTRGLRTPLHLLAACAAAMLVLACLNLAGIELATVAERVRELRVRAALGASRGRLVRQLVTESLVLAGAGGAAGLLLASAGIGALRAMLPGGTPGLDTAGLDARVLAAAAALTVATGLVIGVLPALRAGARSGRPGRPGGGTATATFASVEGRRLQAVLVVGQVALALVLTTGAGLLGRSLTRLHDVPVGYDTERVLTFEVRVHEGRRDDREAYFEGARERIRALPGVSAVGASTRLPLSTGMGVGVGLRVVGREDQQILTTWVEATDDWFEAMGVRTLAGRDLPRPFSETPGIVLTRSAADSLFGGGPAVGGTVQWFLGSWSDPIPVVGVVEDVRMRGSEDPGRRIAFVPFRHASNFGFAIRTTGDPAALTPAVRDILTEVDPSLAPYAFRTTGDALAQHLAARSAVARLTGLFGSVALLLTALGLYGLVARTIEGRRRELGVRLALGASPTGLLRRTVASGVGLGLLGVAVGLAIFLPLSSAIEELLYGVRPRDPAVLAPVVLVVLAVTAAATWLPARTTMRLDPRDALTADT